MAIVLAAPLPFVVAAAARSGSDGPRSSTSLVAAFRLPLVINGIATTRDGRAFAPFQRQGGATFLEVGEIGRDGAVVPFSDAAWNGWRVSDDPRAEFVAVNALRIGRDGALWIVDTGAPSFGALAPFIDTSSTGGTAMDGEGNIHLSGKDRREIIRIAADGRKTVVAADDRLDWVDAMWIDDPGRLLAPASQLDRTAGLNGDSDATRPPFTIFAIPLGLKPLRR